MFTRCRLTIPGESTSSSKDEKSCHTSVTHWRQLQRRCSCNRAVEGRGKFSPVHHGRTRVLERVSRVLRDTISMGLGPPCTDCRDCGRLSRACLYRTRAHLPFRTTRGMLRARYQCHLSAERETSNTTFLYCWCCRCLTYRNRISTYKVENF